MASSATIAERMRQVRSFHVHGIPYRQAEILGLAAAGFSDVETAMLLNIALNTVRNHGHDVRGRLAAGLMDATRANAVAWAWAQRNCCMASSFRAILADCQPARERLELFVGHHVPGLTPRQRDVLALGAEGFSDSEAAAALHLSPHTARTHARVARLAAIPPSCQPTRANAVAWVHLHRRCCV